MRQKKLLLLCAVILLLLGIPAMARAAGDSTDEDPRVIIARDDWMPVFQAGEDIMLNIPVSNTSTGDATNVSVIITPGEADKFPFETNKMAFARYSYLLPNSSKTMYTFNLKVKESAAPGIYPIAVSVSYSSLSGGGGSVSNTIYVKVENDRKPGMITIQQVELPADRLPIDESVLIKLWLQNTGGYPLHNLEARLQGFAAKTINLDQWPELQTIEKLEAGESQTLEYRLYIDPELETGTYSLDLKLKYTDTNEKEGTQEEKIYLPVAGKDSGNDKITPRVIIDNYSIPGDYVQAGRSFPLQISFYNTSTTTAIYNMKISLSSENQIFSPVGSSSSFFIEKMEPGERVEKEVYLIPKIEAENQNYIINADLDYQDNKGTKFTEKELISIPVRQETLLVVSGLELPPQVFMDNQTNISIDFYNAGRVSVRNITVKLEGQFEVVGSAGGFLGNLEPGKDNYYDFTFAPHQEGTVDGNIILQYEDSIGQQYTLQNPFTLEVMAQPEMPEMDPGMDMNVQPEAKFYNNRKAQAIGAGVLLLAITAIVVIKVRRKRRQLKELELDD